MAATEFQSSTGKPVSVSPANPLPVTSGTGATDLGKAEDSVHTTGDVGVFQLNVRKDTAVSTAGTDGDYAGDISNSTGHKWIAEGFAPQSEDNTLAITKVGVKGVCTRMSTATTTTAKSGAGVLNGIVINKAVATGTITVYDNTAASGTVLALITFGAALLTDPPILALYGIAFATGCTVITSQATDITISTT